MRLNFKQRFFSWLDSYDIYDEEGSTVFTVEGRLSWGHCLHIMDACGNHIGTLQEKIFTFLPQFEIYIKDNYIGCIKKEFTFFKPLFNIDFNGWRVDGKWMEWDYTIWDGQRQVAAIYKELFHWTDMYILDIADSRDALGVLLVALAIDAEKCSRG